MNTRETPCPHCGRPIYYVPEPAIGSGRFVRCPNCNRELAGVLGHEVRTKIEMIGGEEKR
jgi:DNA-directed RNA polymerase subunit RPC12/RpoP